MQPKQRHHVAWPDRTYGPWWLELQFAPLAGRWELVGLAIQPSQADLTMDEPSESTGGPLTTAMLRSIPLAQLTAEWRDLRARTNRELVDIGAIWLTSLDGARLDSEEAVSLLDRDSGASAPVGRPHHWTDQRLMEVARVYVEAWTNGQRPTAAVAAHFHKGHSGAAKLVQMARRRGLLPKTKPGKAGWLPPRQPASTVKPKEASK